MVLKFESEKDFKEMGRDSHRTPFVGMLQAIGLTCLSPQLSKTFFSDWVCTFCVWMWRVV